MPFGEHHPLPPTPSRFMAHLATDSLRTSRSILERALKTPSSTIWLGHVCITTTRFEQALDFYAGTLGLSIRTVERHPLHFDRLRAVMVDAEGRDVLELVEAGEAAPTRSVHQLGFRLPRRSWQVLRARLDAQEVPYRQEDGQLVLHDCDGVLLRIEALH